MIRGLATTPVAGPHLFLKGKQKGNTMNQMKNLALVKNVALSTITVAIVFGFSAFSAQPTLASGMYHLFLVLPGLFLIKFISDFEGYRKARDELAPGKPLGHTLYRIIEWMETPHLGLLGIWWFVIFAAILMIYKYFH